MKNIYVMFGTTGEYSDRTEWAVCGYADEDMAKRHVEAATLKAKEIEATRDNRYSDPTSVNPYDPAMRMDYTGTDYYIVKVEVRESFPPPEANN